MPFASLEDSVDLRDVFAITPVYQDRWQWTLSNNAEQITSATTTTSTKNDSDVSLPTSQPPLCGFQIHSYQKSNDSLLQEVLINFRSDQSEQIEHWFQLLSRILDSRKRKAFSFFCVPLN